MDLKVGYDFSDILSSFDGFNDDVKSEEMKIGEDGVSYAKENGNYHDVSGNLRNSTKYEVSNDGIRIYNDAPYASEIESRGFDVVSGAALYVESKAKEIFE